MTICIATSNYTPDIGGIATFSRRLAKILATAGHTIIILTIDLTTEVIEPDSHEKIENNILIIRLKKSFRTKYIYYKKYFKEGSIDAPYWIATGLAMQEWISNNYKSYNINVIEASAYGGIGAFLIEKKYPPVLLSGHGAFFQYKQINKNKENVQTKLVEKLELLAFKKANGIISHSPLSKEDIEQYTTTKVHLARIAFLPDYNTMIDNDSELLPDKKYALVVGGLQQLKGTFALFDALNNIEFKQNDLTIIWAGSDHFYQKTGRLMSVELAIKYPDIWNKKIFWENNPSDFRLASLYKNASFIIIPTIWESFNVISLEAAFFKKAIIITETTGSSYLFEHKENAIVIKPEDSQGLAKAITELNNSNELCLRLGEASYNSMTVYFSINKIAEERIGIYNKTINTDNQNTMHLDSSYFRPYTTSSRRIYFFCRKAIKKLINW